MNFYINKHNKITQDKLRVLKSKNPKDVWKIINSIEKSKIIKLSTLKYFTISLKIK